MFALGMPLAALLTVGGIDLSAWRTDAPELLVLGMAFTMSVPMAGWMRCSPACWRSCCSGWASTPATGTPMRRT